MCKLFINFAAVMACNITIDQGNTSAKIAVWHDDMIVFESCYHTLCPDDIMKLHERFRHIDASIYCTVTKRDGLITDALRQHCGKTLELSSLTPMPLTIEYRTPGTLGLDRIAAMVGARSLHVGKWLLVVDMGTAITYDVVSPEGHFIGGNIAPGIFMRLEALNHFTARLPLTETDGDRPLWGYDTETALRSGAITGVLGELHYYRQQLPEDAKVILTGGSADIVSALAAFDITIDHDLVSRGLNCIIKHNEDK